ncbi:DedA family protein [Gemmata sp. JC717]|uniref:DedA family protein n=1 Tax=Gemmata algarum TaxID=2975278 RepID=UPI0021BB5FB8|nr:DedA family protein [Gemmata algarum]MDY3555345.1 DedA family protein [Gemmata algarum]
MLEHLSESGYHYLGVFTALIASASVVPVPEELPVITAGIMVGHGDPPLRWYIMLPVLMAGVVIGDGSLYAVGRIWGRRLLQVGWVQRRIVTPEKREQIEKNFHDRGIMILLGARLLPGIRGPIFVMAGVLRVPVGRFMLADVIYAIPLVNIMFWLSYFLTDQVLYIFNKINEYKPLVVVAILSGVAGALIQKYVLSRHISTGEAPHVPDIIAKPAVAAAHAVEKVVDTVTGRHTEKATVEGPQHDGAAEQEFGIRAQEPAPPQSGDSSKGEDRGK